MTKASVDSEHRIFQRVWKNKNFYEWESFVYKFAVKVWLFWKYTALLDITIQSTKKTTKTVLLL
jgi:hypothetical protein